MEVVASLSQGRTAAAQCGLFTYKSVPAIFEPPSIFSNFSRKSCLFDTMLKNGRIGRATVNNILRSRCFA